MPNPVVIGSALSGRRFLAISESCDSFFRERLGIVHKASRPQRLWPGLVLLLSPAALIGGFSTSAEAQCVSVSPIISSASGATVINNGCITTGTSGEDGIRSTGDNATITNSGTVTKSGGTGYGISSSGANPTITNSGTVTTSVLEGNGIASTGPNATITNTNSGTITTSGSLGWGIYSTGNGPTITNSGIITTSGFSAFGIHSAGVSATITNSGTITTSGVAGDGIDSTGTSATITNSGAIAASGLQGNGIYSTGANVTITNSGTITTSGPQGNGIFSAGASATITNFGTITASGLQGLGIYSSGANVTITNSGTITATSHGIEVRGSSARLSNLGAITAGAGFFGIRVTGTGSVVTLTNVQGGNTPLTYQGALPATYNAFVRSLTSFGRLAVSSPTGTMTFGVDAGSTLGVNRYTNVLTGVSASAITNEETLFSLGGFTWRLSAGSPADSWDLLVMPGSANTQLGLQYNSSAVHSVLAQRAAVTTYALDYDCPVFDQHGLCVSVGFRNAQMGSNYADSGETAGLLTAAYRVTPQFRVGGFIDQGLLRHSPVGVDPKDAPPMLGAFAVYQTNQDFSGLTLRASLAYQQGNLDITRPELTSTEAGTGRARTSALAFGGEAAYGFPIDSRWVAQLYAGLRHSDSQRQGYTETTSGGVSFPITYNDFGQQVTSATAGLRLRGAITPHFSLTFGAGMEYDLNSKVDRYSGRSTIPDLETFSLNASQQQNELRAVGSVGMRYNIASNQALAFDASVRQMPYGNAPSITTMLRYSIGF